MYQIIGMNSKHECAAFAKSGVPSAFIGNDVILKSFVATVGLSHSTWRSAAAFESITSVRF